MSKRRNAKKEKAARNRINARKFRKQTSRYSKRDRRWSNYKNENTEEKSSETNSNQSTSSESTSAANKNS